MDLSPIVAAEFARLRAALDAVSSGPAPGDLERAVHAARRSVKALRAILRLLGPARSETARRDVDTLLRELSQSLSTTRDLHVAVATVLALRRRLDTHREGGGKRRRALQQKLAALASEWSDRASAVERGRRQHRSAAPALEVVEARFLALGLALEAAGMAAEASRAYGKARASLRSALKSGDATALHGARTLLVRHQLQFHLLCSMTGGGRRRLRELGRLRDLLGEHHDLSVAVALAGDTPHGSGLGTDLARIAGRRQRVVAERCRPLAAALFSKSRARWRDRLAARLDDGSDG